MNFTRSRWILAPKQPGLCRTLASELSISPLLAQCLVNRGFVETTAAQTFLEPRLKHLADPFLIPNMDAAVTRLLDARSKGERVVLFGDYDVDGVTSTALLTQVLGALGWKVDHYLPNRRDEGYGLSAEGVRHCMKNFPAKLLLAVDCGSSSFDAIETLRASGIEVIVLDHHQVSSPAPNAVALVNPRVVSGASIPFANLCSAGLAFKLAHALVKRLRDEKVKASLNLDIRAFLDLAALGTIADQVPLTGENRILAIAGLDRISARPCAGLAALKTVAQCPGTVGGYEAGFQLAPRLNAAGRLEDAELSLRLLLAASVAEAEPMARLLDDQNRERQAIERAMALDVSAAVRADFAPDRDFVIVEGKPSWHVGVVGIVASRVMAEFYRPTIIFGGDGSLLRGSGRSIEGFDLAAALRQCGDLLVRHGGHSMAAGVTLKPEQIGPFRARLNELARAALPPERLQPALRLDAEVALHDLTVEEMEELDRLNPTGQANPPVRLAARGLRLQQPPQRMGKEKQHARMHVTDGRKTIDAVWWNCGDAPMPQGSFDLAFTPQIDAWNGRRTVQLKVIEWRCGNSSS